MLFRYCLTTHEGKWKEGHCRDFGWSAANPLIGVVVDSSPAKSRLGKTTSFCQVDVPNVFLLTFKRAEDGKGLIIRLIENRRPRGHSESCDTTSDYQEGLANKSG